MARWLKEVCETEERSPVDDLKSVFKEAKSYRENPLLVPGEQKEMFESAAQKAREAGIYVPPLMGVWIREKQK